MSPLDVDNDQLSWDTDANQRSQMELKHNNSYSFRQQNLEAQNLILYILFYDINSALL